MAFTRAGTVGDGSPTLVDHMRLVPANSGGIDKTMDVIRRRSRGTNPIREVLADRAFSYSTVDTWASPLHQMQVQQVLDMHENDRGAQPHVRHGYVMVDGWPHAPGIPDRLTRIVKPANLTVPALKGRATERQMAEHAAQVREVQTFRDLIAERRTWAFERVGKTSSGNYRYRSPARAGKLRCPGFTDSLHFPADTPECVHPEGQPIPRSCQQATITVSVGAGLKLRQEHYWGSDEWIRSYSRRSRVEATFGLLKATNGGGVKRGWTGLTGLIRTALMLAIQVSACNLRTLRRWAHRTGDNTDPLVRVDLTEHGVLELGPDGVPLPFDDDSPPGAEPAAA